MSDTTDPTIYIDYDAKVQEALRSVVHSVLSDAAKDGLKGEHHFYISFRTQDEGVNIPQHLSARFPEEMTIVMQHKFWGLKVRDDFFEIVLSFNQQPETLVIPFSSIVGFVDPSVQFALQFHDNVEGDNDDEGLVDTHNLDDAEAYLTEGSPLKGPQADQDSDDIATAPKATNSKDDTKGDASGGNVVTLDAFRKK